MSSVWVDLLGAEVRFYDAAGIRTRCIEAGDGPPLIFLHGVGGHAEAFSRNVVPLSDRFRVIALDYLGSGLTDRTSGQVGKDQYVEHLLRFMDAAGVAKAHLAGESLGGWIAFWTALDHPDRVADLISICGARLDVETDAASQRHVEEGRAELKRLTRQFLDQPTRENVRRRLAWLFRHPERDITEELVEIRWRMYQRSSALASLSQFTDRPQDRHRDNAPEAITAEHLARLHHRTLMLWTTHNPSTTAATAERASRHLPAGEFTVMQDCAHWPQWEDPATFNRIVREFLSPSGSGGGAAGSQIG